MAMRSRNQNYRKLLVHLHALFHSLLPPARECIGQNVRGGLERAVGADQAEVGFVGVVDRVVVQAPRQGAGGVALFHSVQNDLVKPGLLRLGARGVAYLVTQPGGDTVLGIALPCSCQTHRPAAGACRRLYAGRQKW